MAEMLLLQNILAETGRRPLSSSFRQEPEGLEERKMDDAQWTCFYHAYYCIALAKLLS